MTNLLRFWKDAKKAGGFQAGVCLHGHTLHSEECLWFLPRYLRRIPGVIHMVRHVDFARAYWTPPLPPAAALELEQKQIEKIGLRPLVSLTDHDNIEAALSLRTIPVSVEWTVPYESTILHLGVHNLPEGKRDFWMAAMAAYTAKPNERKLPDILRELDGLPGVLLVLNHPFWLEEGITREGHDRSLPIFLRNCVEWIHAFEFNGTRKWPENQSAMELAKAYARPVISGGDRHACEPSACLNLTNAATFEEFVAEIRAGESTIMIMPQYRKPMTLRIGEAISDILRPYPQWPARARWTDRIFYRGDDGIARSLSVIWGSPGAPSLMPNSRGLNLSVIDGMENELES